MRAVIQRVTQAAVETGGERIGHIGRGLLVLVGVTHGDGVAEAEWLAAKVLGLRIFEDPAGGFQQSVMDVGGSVLVVSQFTLYADTGRGRRPSFSAAAPAELAEPLYDEVVRAISRRGVAVATGRFGAAMQVALVNDGPVTIILDSMAA
jgi:D-tyrosyl-tRNA(Tyr) deacylase